MSHSGGRGGEEGIPRPHAATVDTVPVQKTKRFNGLVKIGQRDPRRVWVRW